MLLAARGDETAQQQAQAMIAELARTPPFQPTGRDALALGAEAGPLIGRVLATARRDWIDAGAPAEAAAQAAFVERALVALLAAR